MDFPKENSANSQILRSCKCHSYRLKAVIGARVNLTLKTAAAPELHPVAVKNGVWKQRGIDLVGPLVETPRGNKYIIGATDYFSKWPEAQPSARKNAISVALFLYDLFCRHGAAEVIISDQGREFVNTVSVLKFFMFRTVYSLTGIPDNQNC